MVVKKITIIKISDVLCTVIIFSASVMLNYPTTLLLMMYYIFDDILEWQDSKQIRFHRLI